MQTQNIFIAHPANAEQVNALKAVLKALKIKFEITTSAQDRIYLIGLSVI